MCVSELNIIFPYLLNGRLAEEHEFMKIEALFLCLSSSLNT